MTARKITAGPWARVKPKNMAWRLGRQCGAEAPAKKGKNNAPLLPGLICSTKESGIRFDNPNNFFSQLRLAPAEFCSPSDSQAPGTAWAQVEIRIFGSFIGLAE